jgi:DNA-binding MarR family transcriptional regulator
MVVTGRSSGTRSRARPRIVSARARTSLLVRHLGPLTRTEASLLNTLGGGPRRITELAELEGLAQPTITLLVQRLEQQALLTRERQADDGRVVVVTLTPLGSAALEDYRAQASETLGAYLTEMSDEHIEALAAATEALAALAWSPARLTRRSLRCSRARYRS